MNNLFYYFKKKYVGNKLIVIIFDRIVEKLR